MTNRYVVSCFAPPNQLEIAPGQTVKVDGWKRKNKIRATSVTNVSKKGPTCNCGIPPKALIGLGEKAMLEGIVSNIQHFSGLGVKFDLETNE